MINFFHSLQISGLYFLIFKEFTFSGLHFFSNFTSFFLTCWVKHDIIMLANFFPIGGPVFSTALKFLAIYLIRSSSSLSSGSESSLIVTCKINLRTFGGVQYPVGQFAHPNQSHHIAKKDSSSSTSG